MWLKLSSYDLIFQRRYPHNWSELFTNGDCGMCNYCGCRLFGIGWVGYQCLGWFSLTFFIKHHHEKVIQNVTQFFSYFKNFAYDLNQFYCETFVLIFSKSMKFVCQLNAKLSQFLCRICRILQNIRVKQMIFWKYLLFCTQFIYLL